MSLKSKTIIPLLLLVFLGIWAGKASLTEPFFSTHDGDDHLARTFEAVEALSEGHFPLRWGGKLNGFCGVPVFNFFYPLLYYLAAGLSLLTGNVLLSLEIIFFISFILAPVFFFFWLVKETDNFLAAFIGALIYLFVPYRFLLVYVRGNPEFLTYTILPIFLYQASCLIDSLKTKSPKNKKVLIQGFSLSFWGAMIALSHNISAMITAPVVLLWLILKIFQEKVYQKKSALIFIFLIAFSIFAFSAFFWGPMILEQNQTKLANTSSSFYHQHFPTLKQLIRSSWGYGYSGLGTENDGLSFMLGYAQWLVLLSATIFIGYRFSRKRLAGTEKIVFWYLLSGGAIFLMLEISGPIWELVKPLQIIQFPWRLLGITSFTIAAMAGFLVDKLKFNKLKFSFIVAVFFLALYGNRNHLRVNPVSNENLYRNFSQQHPKRYQTTTFANEILHPDAKGECQPYQSFLAVNNQVLSNKPQRGSTYGLIHFDWPKEEKANINLNLSFFPGIYKITVNDDKVSNKEVTNDQGLIKLNSVFLKEGENQIRWQITQSPKQRFFNYFSLFSFAAWLAILVFSYVSDKKR
ncbi:MAG: hypothetical protein ACOYJ8_03465 [Patescibacteria group bacterium]|jgi:hypothetical protein